ncbi:unnamed protein product [Trichogramma brassicae]|uniref:Uncharacterized protein n=1 Tax=Trichogramma brassicae TaxID=86971 RepID=A0A6H5IEC9_9HYME|nr:unnamed protein product [Trichogramma brassicae]
MAPERRPHHHHHNHRVAKKRVRILPGHEARFIEKRRPARSANRVQKRATSTKAKRMRQQGATMLGRAAAAAPRTHKPTVAELVYRYLESVSNRGVCKSQKTSATSQFRRHQRQVHPRRLKPDRHRGHQRQRGSGQRRHNDNNDIDAPRRMTNVVGYDEFKRQPASPCAHNDNMYSYTGGTQEKHREVHLRDNIDRHGAGPAAARGQARPRLSHRPGAQALLQERPRRRQRRRQKQEQQEQKQKRQPAGKTTPAAAARLGHRSQVLIADRANPLFIVQNYSSQ